MRDELVTDLRTHGRTLEENPFNVGCLRELQAGTERFMYSEDSFSRFISYFVFELIDSLLFNLVGDVGYSKTTDSLRRDFFRDTGFLLVQLASFVEAKRKKESFEACEKLVFSYLTLIESINQIPSQKLK